MRKYEKQAAEFCEAICTLADNTRNLENLESYLSYHFEKWLKTFANTPEGLAAEMKMFAEMEV